MFNKFPIKALFKLDIFAQNIVYIVIKIQVDEKIFFPQKGEVTFQNLFKLQ